jgi:hypothetical protein
VEIITGDAAPELVRILAASTLNTDGLKIPKERVLAYVTCDNHCGACRLVQPRCSLGKEASVQAASSPFV